MVTTIFAAGPTVAVLVKVIGVPVSPGTSAVVVYGPGVRPSVRVTCAMPCALVAEVGDDTEPPPMAVHDTETFCDRIVVGVGDSHRQWIRQILTADSRLIVAALKHDLARDVGGRRRTETDRRDARDTAVRLSWPARAPSVHRECASPVGSVVAVLRIGGPASRVREPRDGNSTHSVAVVVGRP